MSLTHPAPRNQETVLLVEDEDILRTLIRQVLQQNGYTVLDAANATDALRQSAEFPGTIHLLATDMVMPGIGGRQLAEQLQPTRPDMRVLYLSGYTSDHATRSGDVDIRTHFLQKPFTPGVLAKKVREVLDAPLLQVVG